MCRGKYFKVLDADDWFLNSEWEKFVHILLGIRTVDVIVTGYQRYDIHTGEIQLVSAPAGQAVETVLMDQLMQKWMEYHDLFVMQGIIYRTGFCRQHAVKLSEKVSYDDVLYNIVATSQTKNICIINHPVYVYRVGDENKRMSCDSRVADIEHMRIIICELCKTEQYQRSKAGQMYWNYKVFSSIMDFFVTAFFSI